MTTQTFDPPPSAQSTRAGGEPGGVGILVGILSRIESGHGYYCAIVDKAKGDAWVTKEEKPIPACFECLGQVKSVHSRVNGIML